MDVCQECKGTREEEAAVILGDPSSRYLRRCDFIFV